MGLTLDRKFLMHGQPGLSERYHQSFGIDQRLLEKQLLYTTKDLKSGKRFLKIKKKEKGDKADHQAFLHVAANQADYSSLPREGAF